MLGTIIFYPKECGENNWLSLKIITNKLKNENIGEKTEIIEENLCGICRYNHIDIKNWKIIEGCKHKYHEKCYKELEKLGVKCPLCHLWK